MEKAMQHQKRVPRGYWLEIENVKNTLDTLCRGLGHFPSSSEIQEQGYGGMLVAIVRHHGGLKKVRQNMGATVHLVKRRKEWSDFHRVLSKVSEIREKLGHFPTINEVIAEGYRSLINAVNKHHGGWEAIRRKLGEPKRLGRWDTLEEVLDYFSELLEELGHWPTRKDLVERKSSSILHAVQTEYGGIRNIYELLNIQEKQKPKHYWDDFSVVESTLSSIIAELGRFPTQEELVLRNRGDLVSAIHNYHDGMRAVRKRMGFEQLQVEPGYWANFDRVQNVIKELQLELGRYPTILELEHHRPGLKYAILRYHEGYINVRTKMGEELITQPDGYWKNEDLVKSHLLHIEQTIGHFPTGEEIEELGPRGLLAGIFLYHGGLTAIRKQLGKKPAYPSALEMRIKTILDRWVDDEDWIDGGRSILESYNLILRNPDTNRPLELDRFYYSARVAIEIHGHQHFRPAPRFSKNGDVMETLDYRQFLDEQKRQQCRAQHVELIEIKYNNSEEDILTLLHGKLRLRTSPLGH